MAEYLDDRPRAALEYELYVAGLRDETLATHARAWVSQLGAALAPRLEPAAAAGVAMLIEGAILQALTAGTQPNWTPSGP